MRYFIMISFLFLSSCAGLPAQKSETKLVGMSLPDMIACAGMPSKSIATNHEDVVLQYDQNQQVQPNFSLGGIYGVSLNLGGMGTCSLIARFHNGYLGSIHYVGPSWTFGGYLSACTPIIKSCYSRRDHTVIPSDYNQFNILGLKQP